MNVAMADVADRKQSEAREERVRSTTEANSTFVQDVFSLDGSKVPVRVFPADLQADSDPETRNSPIVYFHGLFDHSGWASPIASAVNAAGFSVYAFDRRGSGLSEYRRGFCSSYRDILEDAFATAEFAMNAEDSQGVHIVGSSFGCLPALLFATEFPELCLSITMASPALFSGWYPSTQREGFTDFFTSKKRLAMELKPELLTSREDLQQLIARDILATRQMHSSTRIEAQKMLRLVQKRSKEVVHPVCMMLPGSDQLGDEEAHRRFFERLPSGFTALLTYPDSRHLIDYSADREVYLRDLVTWLSEIEHSLREAKAFLLEEILPLADSLSVSRNRERMFGR